MKNLCVVDKVNYNIYDFVNNLAEAENTLQQAIKRNQEDIAIWESHCENYPNTDSFKNYLTQAQNKKYDIMTYKEFLKMERDYYIGQPLTEITKEQFNEMLNILPPLKWCTRHNVEMFCMSEMLTGTYTSQYMYNLVTGKYYHKVVDITDQTTWGYNFMQ